MNINLIAVKQYHTYYQQQLFRRTLQSKPSFLGPKRKDSEYYRDIKNLINLFALWYCESYCETCRSRLVQMKICESYRRFLEIFEERQPKTAESKLDDQTKLESCQAKSPLFYPDNTALPPKKYVLSTNFYLFLQKYRIVYRNPFSKLLRNQNDFLILIDSNDFKKDYTALVDYQPKALTIPRIPVFIQRFFCTYNNIETQPIFMNFSYILNHQARQDYTPVSLHQNTQQDLSVLHPLPRSKKNAKINPFCWKSTQNKKYISFLKKNTHLMSLPVEERKRIKINVIMSQFIKSKNPEQCRSHHQKMMLKYGSVQGIINSHAPKRPANITAQFLGKIQYKKTVEMCQFNSQITEQPFWHQYIAIFSQEQSRDYVAHEEMLL